MYEDWANERITEYNFNMMSERYQNEQQELDEKIRTLEAELLTEKKVTDNAEKWIAMLKQYSNPTELTAELLNTLVEKILIHETEGTVSEKPNSLSISFTASSVKLIKPQYP